MVMMVVAVPMIAVAVGNGNVVNDGGSGTDNSGGFCSNGGNDDIGYDGGEIMTVVTVMQWGGGGAVRWVKLRVCFFYLYSN